MAKKRIYESAKELNLSSNALVKVLRDLGFDVKSHMSVATDDMLSAIKKKFDSEKEAVKKEIELKEEKERRRRILAQREIDARRAAKRAPAKKPGDKKTAKKPSNQKAKPTTGKSFVKQVEKLSDKMNKGETPVAAKKKKRVRKKRKDRRAVDQQAVAKSFKATMATIETGKSKKKYKKKSQDSETGELLQDNSIEVNEFMTVAELAGNMEMKPAELIAVLFKMGMMASINQRLDMDTIEMLALEFEFSTREGDEIGSDAREDEIEENLVSRAPVVTVMGHVDHGKTSLLDYIRNTSVVSGEAGAITQHIGAYEVLSEGGKIVFIDTPGHEAFTAMRARGAQITDIVILVVAADDGVMPQTVEAIDHARAANVPIIVAINKIDKPGSNPDNIRQGLSKHNIMPEEWGGKTIMVELSAKTGQGIDTLLEMVHLQTEMLDLKADPTIRGQGIVVEAKLEKGRGPVSTIIIQKGRMQIGDPIVAGTYMGHVRSMLNENDDLINEIGPATPIRITGLGGVPQAGDSIIVVHDDQEAREIAQKRSQIKREQEIRSATKRTTLENLFEQIKEGQIKELRLVIKADVDGSAEVLTETLSKIATDEVRTSIIHKGVGAVNESDVLLAAASDAIIIAFNVTPDDRARAASSREKVEIKRYSIIYDVESDIRQALEGMLSPDISEELVGVIEVRQVFKVPKIGAIAGCFVKEGSIIRSHQVHLVRDGVIIHKGTISSLKRFKDDVKEVVGGYECGIGIENYNDVKVGDVIETYKIVETAKTLELKSEN